MRCAGRNVAYLGVGLHGGDDRAFVFAAVNADVFGGPGHDTISVGGGLFASGGSGDDRIFGSASEDIFVGGPGRDLLVGRGGDDSLYGGTGDDRLEVADRGSALGTIDCGPGFDALGVDDSRNAFAPHRCENVIRVRRDGRGRPGSYLRRRPGSRLGTGSDRQSSVCPDC